VEVLGGNALRIRDVTYGEVEPCAQPADAQRPTSG
jgi:hypothetical protein